MDRIKRKNEPLINAIQHAGQKKRMDVGMNPLDVSSHTARDLTQSQGTSTTHRTQNLKAIGSKNSP